MTPEAFYICFKQEWKLASFLSGLQSGGAEANFQTHSFTNWLYVWSLKTIGVVADVQRDCVSQCKEK